MSKYKLQNKIKQSIKNEAMQKVGTTKGIIKEYSNINNVARVEINNPNGRGKLDLNLVQVQLTTGLHTAGPFVGDEVVVEFINGNIMKPKITGFVDNNYYKKSRELRMNHSKKGSYVPDNLEVGINNLFSKKHEKEYINGVSELSTYEKLLVKLDNNKGKKKNYIIESNEQKYPGVSEPALIHPLMSSVVKLRENGNIDIFTGSNTGIRVDLANKTINTFATGINNRVDYIMDYINKDSIHNIKRNWTINSGIDATINANGNVIINSENDIRIKAKKKIEIESGEVKINGKNI